MSKFIGLRLPDSLADKLETRCLVRKQSKTDVLIEAIERGWEEHSGRDSGTGRTGSELPQADRAGADGGRRSESVSVLWGAQSTAQRLCEVQSVRAQLEPGARPEPRPEDGRQAEPEARCTYSEWSGELGETVYCGLPQHSAKIKHGRWLNTTPLAQEKFPAQALQKREPQPHPVPP